MRLKQGSYRALRAAQLFLKGYNMLLIQLICVHFITSQQ